MAEINLPLDLTGEAETNRITGELHTVNDNNGRTITTNYGTFYTNSMVITNLDNGDQLLKPGQDYTLLHLHASASRESGQEVCTVIHVEAHVTGQLSLTYQAVGGDYAGNPNAIRDLIDAIEMDQRAVVWGEILQKPDQFEPAAHLHHLGDLFGWEGMIALIEEIRKAILQGNKPVLDALYHYMDHRFGLKQSQIDQLANTSASYTEQGLVKLALWGTHDPSNVARAATPNYVRQLGEQLTPPGKIGLFMRASAPEGWLPLGQHNTIGSTTSGSVFTGSYLRDLYNVLWEVITPYTQVELYDNNGNPVSKGTSADNDWNSDRRIKLPDVESSVDGMHHSDDPNMLFSAWEPGGGDIGRRKRTAYAGNYPSSPVINTYDLITLACIKW